MHTRSYTQDCTFTKPHRGSAVPQVLYTVRKSLIPPIPNLQSAVKKNVKNYEIRNWLMLDLAITIKELFVFFVVVKL